MTDILPEARAKKKRKGSCVRNMRPFKRHCRTLENYFVDELRTDSLVELQLLLLTFSIGIQDAIAFPDFKCFASNQTGNTVLLATGAAGLGGTEFSLSNIGISLGCFVASALATGQIGHALGPRRRYFLVASHLMQTAMAFGAAALQAVSGGEGSGSFAMGSIALLACSSGGQVASMRPMRVQEITTAMATAAWVDFVIDPGLFVLHNHSRDRRALFLLVFNSRKLNGCFLLQRDRLRQYAHTFGGVQACSDTVAPLEPEKDRRIVRQKIVRTFVNNASDAIVLRIATGQGAFCERRKPRSLGRHISHGARPRDSLLGPRVLLCASRPVT